jgi:hypothetical protein
MRQPRSAQSGRGFLCPRSSKQNVIKSGERTGGRSELSRRGRKFNDRRLHSDRGYGDRSYGRLAPFPKTIAPRGPMTSLDYLLLTLLVIAVVVGIIRLGQPRKKRPRHRVGGRP